MIRTGRSERIAPQHEDPSQAARSLERVDVVHAGKDVEAPVRGMAGPALIARELEGHAPFPAVVRGLATGVDQSQNRCLREARRRAGGRLVHGNDVVEQRALGSAHADAQSLQVMALRDGIDHHQPFVGGADALAPLVLGKDDAREALVDQEQRREFARDAGDRVDLASGMDSTGRVRGIAEQDRPGAGSRHRRGKRRAIDGEFFLETGLEEHRLHEEHPDDVRVRRPARRQDHHAIAGGAGGTQRRKDGSLGSHRDQHVVIGQVPLSEHGVVHPLAQPAHTLGRRQQCAGRPQDPGMLPALGKRRRAQRIDGLPGGARRRDCGGQRQRRRASRGHGASRLTASDPDGCAGFPPGSVAQGFEAAAGTAGRELGRDEVTLNMSRRSGAQPRW